MGPSICALFFIAFTFACFAVSPTAEAANDDNRKLGKDALKVNTTGSAGAHVQKVSAQSEMTKPASRLVANKP